MHGFTKDECDETVNAASQLFTLSSSTTFAFSSSSSSFFFSWNSWNIYGAGVTAKDLQDTADFFVSSGLAAAGENADPNLLHAAPPRSVLTPRRAAAPPVPSSRLRVRFFR